MAEAYLAAYTEDAKSGSGYPSATPYFSVNLPSEIISSRALKGLLDKDSKPSIYAVGEVLLELSSAHHSAARLPSTDMAANFFSVSGSVLILWCLIIL